MALVTDPGDAHLIPLPFGEAHLADFAAVVPAEFGSFSRLYPHAKRAMDMVIAMLMLIALLPILLLVAAAVAIDSSGPILFRQSRVGQYGEAFSMLKFRTMRAERRSQDVGPPEGCPDRRRSHKSMADPRVTRAGRLLRRTCIDELPQLINVVRGEMSLVGPRPELPSIVATYAPWQHSRHLVAPGITGWWQINRAADLLMHEATELDVYYVRHCSLLLDLQILYRTLGAVIDGTGAY